MGLKLILLIISAIFFLLAAFGVNASVRWDCLGWAAFVLSFGV